MDLYGPDGIEKSATSAGEPRVMVYDSTGAPKTSASGTTAAPANADYIVKTSNPNLSAELVATDTATIDFTGSAGTATWDVKDDSIVYGKMQNVSAASRLLGRGSAAGAGDPEEITLGAGLTMTGTTLSGSATGAPTTADYVVGTADAGLSAELVATDTPTIDFTKAAGVATWDVKDGSITLAKMENRNAGVLIGRQSSSSGTPQEITVGANLSMSGTTLSASTHPMTSLFMYLTLKGGL